MTIEHVILSPRDQTIDVSPFAVSKGERRILRASAVHRAFSEAASRLFVAFDSAELLRHLGTHPARKHHRLLLLERRDRRLEVRTTMLAAFFRTVVATDTGLTFLPPNEIAEVLAAPNAADLAIAATYDPDLENVYVIRGSLDSLIVPARHFRRTKGGAAPDFDRVRVIDYGNALALGDYEASMDALLYEQDAEFRRELRKRQLQTDTSFGASVRRLRLQRGLKRSDIVGVSEKQVARIERGEIDTPHGSTLEALAAALEVPAADLGDF